MPGYEEYYEITRRGDVFSLRLNKFIKQRERQEGEPTIELQIDHERHRLPLADTIADAFLSPDEQRGIVAAVRNLHKLPPKAIARHPAVWLQSQAYNLTPEAILSVLNRARARGQSS